MKKRMMGFCTAMGLLLALSMPLSAFESHHEIHEAMESLKHAKEHLEHAAHDFGGHRVEAIRAIDEAQHQLEICMKYDKD
jgi:hypothetical protein